MKYSGHVIVRFGKDFLNGFKQSDQKWNSVRIEKIFTKRIIVIAKIDKFVRLKLHYNRIVVFQSVPTIAHNKMIGGQYYRMIIEKQNARHKDK